MGIPLYKPRETDDATNREKKEHASSLQQLLSRQQALRNALVSHQQARRNGLEAGNATNGNNGRIQPPASPNVATTHRRSRAFVAAIRRANSSLLRRPTQQQSTENEQGNRDRNMTITRRPSNAESLTDDGIDQMVQQRFNEKEDLLNQLQFTASLLGQFLSARSVLGSDTMEIPSFITEGKLFIIARFTIFHHTDKAKYTLEFQIFQLFLPAQHHYLHHILLRPPGLHLRQAQTGRRSSTDYSGYHLIRLVFKY